MMKKSEFLDYVIELLEPSGTISACRMFGGFAIRKDGLAIALLFENEVYFKVDDSNRADYEALDSEPFSYEARGKRIIISNWKLPIEILEDPEELLIWVEKSYQVALKNKKNP